MNLKNSYIFRASVVLAVLALGLGFLAGDPITLSQIAAFIVAIGIALTWILSAKE